MKTMTCLTAFASLMLLPGCIYVRDTTPSRTVVHETRVVGPSETVVTTLPSRYSVRVYRGTRYYYTENTYYRSHPSGGYVIVHRPW